MFTELIGDGQPGEAALVTTATQGVALLWSL